MFITNYKALNYADWAPVASFITGWIHLGLGSQQVAAAKQKMHKLTPETAANDLKNRRIQKWGAAQEEGWKHIRRGLFAILLPIISNIFFMIYDLIHAHKKALPPAIPTPTPEISKEIKIECTPKPPRVVSEPDHDVVLFKQKFNEVRKSDSVGKFLDSITDFKEYAYLAEEITHHEIELWNLSGHNFFKINEFQDVPAPNNDWLFHFMSALPTDKLGTLLNVLVQREDLGEKFFNRLVNIMDELPERQKQFAALKMCMQCNDEGKYYNLLSSLKDNQPAHQAFAIQYLHTFEDSGELLYAKNPLLCEAVCTSPEDHDWFIQYTKKQPQNPQLEAKDPAKLKMLFNSVTSQKELEELCKNIQKTDLPNLLDPAQDPLKIHQYIKTGDIKEFAQFILAFQQTNLLPELFAELKQYATGQTFASVTQHNPPLAIQLLAHFDEAKALKEDLRKAILQSFPEAFITNEETKFLLKYDICKCTLDFAKFFKKIQETPAQLKFLAKHITFDEILFYYTAELNNGFGIKENQYAEGYDWLTDFIPHLAEDKLDCLIKSLLARKDLGTRFYLRLLDVACCMPHLTTSKLTLTRLAEHVAKTHNPFIEALDPKNLSHQIFGQYLSQFISWEQFYYRNYLLCRETIKTLGSEAIPKNWLEKHEANLPPNLLECDDLNAGALACHNNPIKVKAFFNCLAAPTLDEKVIERFKQLVKTFQASNIIQCIKNNDFHFHPNDSSEKYETLLACLSKDLQRTFVYAIACRKGMNVDTFIKLLYAIHKSGIDKANLYNWLFSGLKSGFNLAVLDDIKLFGTPNTHDIVVEAYTALLIDCSERDLPYHEFIPFYQPKTFCKHALNTSLKKFNKNPTMLKFIEKITAPQSLSDLELSAALSAAQNNPKKLRELFKAGPLAYQTKLCNLMSAGTVNVCMQPNNDVFRLYKGLKGKSAGLSTEFLGLQNDEFLSNFCTQLSKTPKNLKRFFEENAYGESFYSKTMNKIPDASKQNKIKKLMKMHFKNYTEQIEKFRQTN